MLNIALLFGEVGFISRKKIIDGIRAASSEDECNLFLFSCEGWRFDRFKKYQIGEYTIFQLPDYKKFDGVIVDFNSIKDLSTQKYIRKQLIKADVPYASFFSDGNANVSVITENYNGIHQIIEHLVSVHHVKEIHYISGTKHNIDATEREYAYISALKEFNLPFEENYISNGSFEYYGGKNVIDTYMATGRKLPDAFIAANDTMAIGVIKSLQSYGYRVPEDIIVTGYDFHDYSQLITPRLTTVNKKDEQVGKQIYYRLKQAIADKSLKIRDIVKGEMVLGHSCGCQSEAIQQDEVIIDRILENQIYIDNNMDYLKSIAIEFSNIDKFDYFQKELKAYINLMKWDYCYLCMCCSETQYHQEIEATASGKQIERDLTRYTETVNVPLAFENGEWTSYANFPRTMLLPPDCKKPEHGIYYIIMPIHYDDICIGYCVVGNKKDTPADRFIQHMVINVNNALGNIYQKELMQHMFQRLNRKSILDELTGLYNRFGLWENMEHFLSIATDSKSCVAILFFDLDCLKYVNDMYGHEEGDQYIKSMAYIMTKCFGSDDILVRYGGDEFIACTLLQSKDEIEEKITHIQQEIAAYNTLGLTQQLSTSIGYSFCDDIASIEVNKMSEQADEAMYRNKRTKKRHF